MNISGARRWARIAISIIVFGWTLYLPAADSAAPPNSGNAAQRPDSTIHRFNDSTNSILQQELKQQQIRSTTQRVGDQLESIIAEFERNGIGGEDVKVLRAIRRGLGK